MDLSPVRGSDTPLARGVVRLELDNFDMLRVPVFDENRWRTPRRHKNSPFGHEHSIRPIPSSRVKPGPACHHPSQTSNLYLSTATATDSLHLASAILRRASFSSISRNPHCPLSLATFAANDRLLTAHQ